MADRDDRNTQSILFICQMNMVRSPMAEGLARKLYPSTIEAQSCGLAQGDADQLVEAVMKEVGVDMSQHTPKVLHNFDPSSFDTVIAFTPSAHEAAKAYFGESSAEIIHWPLPSPEEGSLDIRGIMNNYRSLRDVIKTRLIANFGTPDST